MNFIDRMIMIPFIGVMSLIDIETLESLPIKQAQKTKSLITLVDKILEIKKTKDYLQDSSKQTKVREYQNQMDQLVYKLYNFSPQEIKIIEGNSQ